MLIPFVDHQRAVADLQFEHCFLVLKVLFSLSHRSFVRASCRRLARRAPTQVLLVSSLFLAGTLRLEAMLIPFVDHQRAVADLQSSIVFWPCPALPGRLPS